MKPSFRFRHPETAATWDPGKGVFVLENGTELTLNELKALYEPANSAGAAALQSAHGSPAQPPPSASADPSPAPRRKRASRKATSTR